MPLLIVVRRHLAMPLLCGEEAPCHASIDCVVRRHLAMPLLIVW